MQSSQERPVLKLLLNWYLIKLQLKLIIYLVFERFFPIILIHIRTNGLIPR